MNPHIETEIEAPGNTRGRGRAFGIFFAALAVAGLIALLWYFQTRQFETTDDAHVDAHLNPVTARIDGTITKVYVENGQAVKAGEPLADLDSRGRQAALDQELANLKQAKSGLFAQRPSVPITEVGNATNIVAGNAGVAEAAAALKRAEQNCEAAEAELKAAEAVKQRAEADLRRYALLVSKDEISRQDYNDAAAADRAQAAIVAAKKAAVASAETVVKQRGAQLEQARSQLDQYEKIASKRITIQGSIVDAMLAGVRIAEARVEQARLNLSYTRIFAPVAGIVMQRSAEVGARVSAGQQLLMISQVGDVYVTANYKETQMGRIRPGQSASIHVDALNKDFEGYVESTGGTTKALASALPPDNATGNYVKVVQRIPVRLRFKPHQTGMERLRPGMSARPKIRVGN